MAGLLFSYIYCHTALKAEFRPGPSWPYHMVSWALVQRLRSSGGGGALMGGSKSDLEAFYITVEHIYGSRLIENICDPLQEKVLHVTDFV